MTLLDVAQAMRGKLRDGYSAPQAGGAAMTSEMAYGTARADSAGGFVEIVMDNMPSGADPDDYAFTVACDAPISKDSRVALVTINGTSKAVSTATVAQIAQDASDIANATNQYFWNDTNGIHVSTDEADPAGTRNILINSLGILLRKAAQTLVSISETAVAFFDGSGNQTASFGASGAVVGRTNGNNARIEVADGGLSVYAHYTSPVEDDERLAFVGVENWTKTHWTLGKRTGTVGQYSTAIGEDNLESSGRASVALGANTHATASYSVAMNAATTASSAYQTVIGRNNVIDNSDTYALIVGNGAIGSSPSNAFAVGWNGDVVAAGDITDGSGNKLSDVAPVQLWTGNTTSSATLSETSANFRSLDFVFTDADGTRYYTQRLMWPNGSKTSLSSIFNGSSIMYISSADLSVSGAIVTITNNNRLQVAFNGSAHVSVANGIKLVGVYGYR